MSLQVKEERKRKKENILYYSENSMLIESIHYKISIKANTLQDTEMSIKGTSHMVRV